MSRGRAAVVRAAVAAAADVAVGHPRHAALFALVGGLLLARAPAWAGLALAAGLALSALAAGRAALSAAYLPDAGRGQGHRDLLVAFGGFEVVGGVPTASARVEALAVHAG